MKKSLSVLLIAGLLSAALADDGLVSFKQLSMELATEIAQKSVLECRKQGYQVTAVVLDRAANMQAMARDAYASRFTIEIAERKAGAVMLSGSDSGTFRKNRGDIRPELNHIDGLIMMEGGLPIRAGGQLLGALGISGAPGGEKDAACGVAVLKSMEERLALAAAE